MLHIGLNNVGVFQTKSSKSGFKFAVIWWLLKTPTRNLSQMMMVEGSQTRVSNLNPIPRKFGIDLKKKRFLYVEDQIAQIE